VRELSLHVLDVVQNSLEAGATRIELLINEDLRADRLTIEVTDNGRGMSQELVRRVLDPFVTTRTTRRVGLGLPLFAAAAERCNGKLEIQSELGKGTVVKTTFQHSHIVSTIISILIGNPLVDFEYTHRVDAAPRSEASEFRFTTREIKQELGDVPLSHMSVIQWLREFLTENLAALYAQ
jgi:signal transduction histidine kinase